MSLQEHKQKPAEGGNAGAGARRQWLERGSAVHDSFATSGAASLTLSIPMFASLRRNGNSRSLLWYLLCACLIHHVPLGKTGPFGGPGEKLIA